MMRSPNVGTMLGQRRRRRNTIVTTLGEGWLGWIEWGVGVPTLRFYGAEAKPRSHLYRVTE